jgi:hypothetical protein
MFMQVCDNKALFLDFLAQILPVISTDVFIVLIFSVKHAIQLVYVTCY